MVRILRMGSPIQEVTLQRPTSVRNLFETLSIGVPGGHEVRINQRAAQLSDTVNPGDTVSIVPNVKGGRA